MKSLVFATALLIAPLALATGPDEPTTQSETVSSSTRIETVNPADLTCISWTQSDGSILRQGVFALRNLGRARETANMVSTYLRDCSLVDQLRRLPSVSVRVFRYLSREIPLDPATGQPSGERPFYRCLIQVDFINGLSVNIPFWTPRDPGACQ